MPRVPRCQQHTGSACYHVMNRGHNREVVFHDDEDRVFFLHLLARYRNRFDLLIYHYCLMSNHFHVVVQLDAAIGSWAIFGKAGSRVRGSKPKAIC